MSLYEKVALTRPEEISSSYSAVDDSSESNAGSIFKLLMLTLFEIRLNVFVVTLKVEKALCFKVKLWNGSTRLKSDKT